MVFGRRNARSVVSPQSALAAIKAVLAGLRGCGRNTVGAGGLHCRAAHLCARPSFPARSSQVAPADRLPPLAPAAGATVRPLATWPDDLASAGRGRTGAAATVDGEHLEQTVPLV